MASPIVRPRALVFGGRGMVGRAVATHWRRRGTAVLALSRAQADVTDVDAVRGWARRFDPDVVINCAAFTQVDACEERVDEAMEVNGRAVGHLAEAADEAGAALLQVSTDYVFDEETVRAGAVAGETPNDGDQPLPPIPEDAPTGPRSVYGQSKLVGETEALRAERATVLRTSWLFGPPGPNFPKTIHRLLREGKTPLRVVDDQRGRPTYTPFVARALWDLACRHAAPSRPDVPRVLHYGNRGPVTWYDFARELARLVAPQAEIVPVTTDEFPRPAPRPAHSVLDVSRFEALVGRTVEPWITGLVEYVDTHLEPSQRVA